MYVAVTSTLENLEQDFRTMAREARPALSKVVREGAKVGNQIAKTNARRSSGSHGKLYPRTFTVERITPLIYEYGPDSALPQGGMSFEYGSRNQPPHLDLNKSADVIGPTFARKVGEAADGLFWPDS